MSKKVLITGGAGFIGAHLADELLAHGYDVRALDNLSPQVHGENAARPAYLSPDVELRVGDVRDARTVAEALKGVDAVFHLAAVVGVGQSMYEIARYTEVNNLGTATLLEALIEKPVERLVVASSMSIYGEGLYRASDGTAVPGRERSLARLKAADWELRDENGEVLTPLPTPEAKTPSLSSVYALSKYDQERMCLIVGRAYHVPTVAMRFFNVFGTRQALSNPYTGVLAIFASRYLNGRPPMIFEDGWQQRDFVHVTDVARACRLALETPQAVGQVFNVGSGQAYTIEEIARRMARTLGMERIAPEVTGKYRAGDIRHCFADISLARRTLGYEPQVSLDEGLAEICQWLEGQTAHDHVAEAGAHGMNNSDEKAVLITGGAGFVGSNLADRLLSQGRRVLVYDNLSRPGVEQNAQWLRERHGDRAEIVVADVRDADALRAAAAGASHAFHFAAQVAVTTSLVDPIEDFDINARGTLNLLEALRAQDHPVPLVFTSTNKVYGALPDVPLRVRNGRYEPESAHVRSSGISETRPLDFHSPYGCSKGAADQYVLDYSRTYGLPAVVFRMSCIYGPRQFGTEDQGWVAHFLIRALSGEPITLYGDGMQVRDILFVDDLVDAFLRAQARMPALSGEAFNIGGGPDNTVSLCNLLAMIEQMVGRKPQVTFEEWRPGDQKYYVSDTQKFHDAAGWKPRMDVAQGVEHLRTWLCESRGAPVPHARPQPFRTQPSPGAQARHPRPSLGEGEEKRAVGQAGGR